MDGTDRNGEAYYYSLPPILAHGMHTTAHDVCQTDFVSDPVSASPWIYTYCVQIYTSLFHNTWIMANVCWWYKCTSYLQPTAGYCKHIWWSTLDLDIGSGIPCCARIPIMNVIHKTHTCTLHISIWQKSSFCCQKIIRPICISERFRIRKIPPHEHNTPI